MPQDIKDKPIVLVVDDSPDSLGMINMALDQAGLAVLIALNGSQAMSILDQITPHVILLDAIMPIMDGFETAAHIREKLPLTPIIFMTGLTEEESITKAFTAGGNDYIIKPIKPAELLARIQQHTNNARMLSAAQTALDIVNQHVFSVDSNGKILWSTPQSSELLQKNHLDIPPYKEQFETRVSDWLSNAQNGESLIIQSSDGPLNLVFFKQTHEENYLIKVYNPNTSIDPDGLEKKFHLTHRESEVLLWIAHGKSNREIGEILDLSPRTINKHLEQIFQKLEVDNRTSAASKAIQCILGTSLGKPS